MMKMAPAVRNSAIWTLNQNPGVATAPCRDSVKIAKPQACTHASRTVPYRVHCCTRFRPSSSLFIFSIVGITAPAICTKIDAEMYGMIPSAKTVARDSWPPTNMLYRPSNPPDPWFWKKSLIATTSTPGAVTTDPRR
jgi:hypothetical protein